MTIQAAFDEIANLVRTRTDIVDVGTPASHDAIRMAETFLRVRFPESYVYFLKTWGTLSIGPCEFYGIAGTDFANSKVPNGIWFTQTKRDQVGLPRELVVLCDNNGDEYHCLNISSEKVVVWNVATRSVVGVRANDVFNFILAESTDWL